MKKDPNRYPKGMDREKAWALANFYENQSDADAIAEAEAAYRKRTSTLIEVPVKLLPEVRRLLARAAKAV